MTQDLMFHNIHVWTALELLSSGYGVAPLPRKNPNDRFRTSQYDIEVLDKQRRNYTWLATSDFYI